MAALPAEETGPEVSEHLATCSLCREHVRALRRTVDLGPGRRVG
ncbi:hypothetical protein [Pseudonocardia sp. H11422]|nr:hypothetical protein [Pseudonocardia sp. H11422]